MAKRAKRAKKGIESLKKVIEEHFLKIENDIREKKIETGIYHADEIEKNLLTALKKRLEILGKKDDGAVKVYEERLNNLIKKLDELKQ